MVRVGDEERLRVRPIAAITLTSNTRTPSRLATIAPRNWSGNSAHFLVLGLPGRGFALRVVVRVSSILQWN